MSRSTMHSDIRLTPLEQYFDTYEDDPPWHAKNDSRALWRGSTTGVWFDRLTRWRSSQRVRLYWLTRSAEGERAVRMPARRWLRAAVQERWLPLASLARRYLDFAFTGEIVQCTEDDGGCDSAKRLISLEPGMIWNDQNRYKYLLDIDGNAWSGAPIVRRPAAPPNAHTGRFHRLMSTNSLVLKATIFKEWYADRIQPWLHYVPVDPSYSDLCARELAVGAPATRRPASTS